MASRDQTCSIATLVFLLSTGLCPGFSIPHPASCYNGLGKAAEDGPSGWDLSPIGETQLGLLALSWPDPSPSYGSWGVTL